LKGKIVRASFLGADMDYLIGVEDTVIRTQMNTHDALEQDLILREGDECVVHFHGVNWFDQAALHKEAV
jgi:iron(III) transport system ATP-binding protein